MKQRMLKTIAGGLALNWLRIYGGTLSDIRNGLV